jgi:ribosomal protein L37E
MNKLVGIAKAWIIAANPNPEQKLLAESRTSVCSACPHKAYNETIDLYYCSLCGCPLSKKIFSPSGPNECPDKRWEN